MLLQRNWLCDPSVAGASLQAASQSHSPLVFGEVLFDHFSDGQRVLGGAPFNVAWHLQGFGATPRLISRVGRDPQGDTVRGRMQDWGMDCSGIQADAQHSTGSVVVSLEGDQPQFEICAEQAYDFIERAEVNGGAPMRRQTLLYHGTLAGRAPTSRQTLFDLRRHTDLVFVDVNLRPPWWDAALVRDSLATAQWVKLNDSELVEIAARAADAESLARDLVSQFGLRGLVVTLGAQGAFLVRPDAATVRASSPPVQNFIDSVGAGDALSAVMTLGILRGWEPQVGLRRAVGFASKICAIRGATTSDHGLYATCMHEWTNERD